MGRAVFSPSCLTWDQTMVEVMKILVTSFKRSHAPTAAIRAPGPAAGHCRPTPPPETPGHSRASLSQSLVGSLLLSPRSWCAQGFVCALQNSVSPGLCKFCNQFLLTSEVKFPGGSQSLCQIPRFIDYAKAFDCVDHKKLWKVLKEMGIADHLTCLLRNLDAGQEA